MSWTEAVAEIKGNMYCKLSERYKVLQLEKQLKFKKSLLHHKTANPKTHAHNLTLAFNPGRVVVERSGRGIFLD